MAVVESLRNAKRQPGTDARRQILRRAHLAGDLVDPLEAEATDLAHEHVRIPLQNGHDLAAEAIYQRRHLVMRQAEPRQICHRRVEVGVRDPETLQRESSLDGNPGDARDALRRSTNDRIEAAAKLIGDRARLRRADTLHIRMVRQEIGQAIRIHLQVITKVLRGKLPAVFRMFGPVSFQPDGLARADEDLAGKGDKIAVRSAQFSGAKRRAGIEHDFHDAAEARLNLRDCGIRHTLHLLYAPSRYACTKWQAAWRLEQKNTGTRKSRMMESALPSTALGCAAPR